MPQQPAVFDPNEFSGGQAFDPNEFAPKQLQSPVEPSWYDTVASYIPDPVKSTWNFANKPLTDYITDSAGNRIIDPAAAANYYDNPATRSEDEWKIPDWVPFAGGGSLRSLGAGMLEGAGNVVTGLSSPLNLATLGAFKGASSLAETAPTVARRLQITGRSLSAPVALQGGATALNPNASTSERLFSAAQAAGGFAGMAAPTPKAKPVGAGASEGQLPVRQPAAPIEPEMVTPESMPVRPPNQAAPMTPEVLPTEAKAPLPAEGGYTPEVQRQQMLDLVKERMPTTNEGMKTRLEQERRATPGQSPTGVERRAFDPNTLQGLERTPQPEAVQPTNVEQVIKSIPRTGDIEFDNMVSRLQAMRAKAAGEGFTDAEFNAYSDLAIEVRSHPSMPPELNQLWSDIGAASKARGPKFQVGDQVQKRTPTQATSRPTLVEPQSEMQFVDPNTGEIKVATEAKPGDVPFIPEAPPNAEAPMPVRRAGKRMGQPNLGLSKPPAQLRGTVNETPKLPRDLAGAKPRFNAGTQFYNPQFADDLDKALYIIAQTRKSASDAKYLKFVMDNTGLDEAGARALGQEVKTAIKAQAKNSPGGDIQIPQIARKKLGAIEQTASPTETPAPGEVRGYIQGKPQVSTGEVNPANVKPDAATEVIESLNRRLDKAIEEPNPTTAPKELSEIAKESAGIKEPGIIRKVLAANKALLTSWDLSAPGRQGKAFMFNKAYWTSLDDMVKAWGSKAAADTIHQSILDHPSGYFKEGITDAGKKIPSFAEKMGLDLAANEEMFTQSLGKGFEKYSGVGKANRAHTAFLNKLRSDQFVSMMDAAKKAGMNPETDTRIARAYAKFINDATGRGSLHIGDWKLENNTRMINDVFFAPRNMAGQIRTWNNVLNPVKYWNYDPVLRQQALKSLFAVAGAGLAVGEMARMAGAKVSNDPTSSDFRKIKIGDVRIDLFGGYQQFPVAAAKLLMGESTSTTSGKTTDLTASRFGQQTRQSVAERFFTNRLSPVASFVWAWMGNREFDGKPFEVKRALFERVFPIAAKDILDMTKEDPALAATLAVPTLLGLSGTQTYTGR